MAAFRIKVGQICETDTTSTAAGTQHRRCQKKYQDIGKDGGSLQACDIDLT